MHVFITGITGTLGNAIVNYLCRNGLEYNQIFYPHDKVKISGVTRSEKNLQLFKSHKNVNMFLCNIVDIDKLKYAMSLAQKNDSIDIIYHLAALKHVELGEQYIDNFLDTNVSGTKNILSLQNFFDIKKVVFPSTDKAVEPVNAYGCTKLLAEKLVLKNPSNTVCRYGNVFGSNGSLVQKLKYGKPGLTHKSMTRFFIDIDAAAEFVIKSTNGQGVKIPKMKAAYIKMVMDIYYKYYDPKNAKYPIVGIRKGEKIHEKLDSKTCSKDAVKFTENEILALLDLYLKRL